MNRKPQDEIEEIKEEADYENEPVCTVEKVAAPPDYRIRFFTRSFPLIAVCWLILLVIMGLRIYFTSVISANNAKLTAEIQQLNTRNQELDANLRKDHNALTVQFDNLTKAYTVLESKTTSLTAENQKLETQRNNLTERIRDMETNWNELNVSRAQWSIDAYCPKTENRKCKVCQMGWEYTNPNCYAILNAEPAERRTWEEAREDCRGKNSDFTVIHTQHEKNIINGYSWGTNGYWIGLRVQDGKWKWIDGSNLTVINWARPQPPTPPTDGHCAISVQGQGWKSVSCDVKQQWICKKNALSL